mmetsp:Transcript_51363/g.107295  ORF Transcript_51363/g.107295 Transcript_51363/m.107295 type:complete len:102 (-) Transcript_51363:590-895(-)
MSPDLFASLSFKYSIFRDPGNNVQFDRLFVIVVVDRCSYRVIFVDKLRCIKTNLNRSTNADQYRGLDPIAERKRVPPHRLHVLRKPFPLRFCSLSLSGNPT